MYPLRFRCVQKYVDYIFSVLFRLSATFTFLRLLPSYIAARIYIARLAGVQLYKGVYSRPLSNCAE